MEGSLKAVDYVGVRLGVGRERFLFLLGFATIDLEWELCSLQLVRSGIRSKTVTASSPGVYLLGVENCKSYSVPAWLFLCQWIVSIGL